MAATLCPTHSTKEDRRYSPFIENNQLYRVQSNYLYLRRRNHYQRPLEEAVQTHASQWPKAWQGKNPLHGGRNFASMEPNERVNRTLSSGYSTILTTSRF